MRVLRRRLAAWVVRLPDCAVSPPRIWSSRSARRARTRRRHAYSAAEEGAFDYTVARRADGDIEVAVRDFGRCVRRRRTTVTADTGCG